MDMLAGLEGVDFNEIMNEPEKDTVLEDIHQWLEKRL